MIEDWGREVRIVRALGTDEKDVVPVRTAAGLTKTTVQNFANFLRALPVQPRQLDAVVSHPGQLAHGGVKVRGGLLPYGIYLGRYR